TNNFNCTVRVTPDDTTPDVLDAKIGVAGSMNKLFEINGGAVTLILSNSITGDGSALTGLNASELASGIVPDARLTGAVPSLGGLTVTGDTTIDGATFSLVNGASASFSGVTAIDTSGAVSSGADITITESSAGIVLKSPNGTYYRIKVDDAGV